MLVVEAVATRLSGHRRRVIASAAAACVAMHRGASVRITIPSLPTAPASGGAFIGSDRPAGRTMGTRSMDASVTASSGASSAPSPRDAPAYLDPAELKLSLSRLQSLGVTLIVWDFDLTILAIHSFGERISAAAVASRSLEDDFTHLAFFRAIVSAAEAAGVRVAIASFGKYEVIQAYMSRVFSEDCPFGRGNIITPSCVGGVDGTSIRSGKNKMLTALRDTVAASKGLLMFFDDDDVNVDAARECDFARAFHCPRGFDPQVWKVASDAVLRGGASDATPR